ncbi:MAG: class I SAM-dependent methyltransferase, partial [Gammaproteobacteria bacterium]|nr:class I SAM-dependent methyltransferase [Gammaproteobacteria bacterium]
FPVTLLKEHVENLARADITDTIQIRADSMKLGPLWQIPIDLLFIDGGHEHHVVFQDIRNFSPWVKRGGIMALHDHSGEHPLHASVRRACAEWLNAFGPLWTEIPGADSIRAFRRDR